MTIGHAIFQGIVQGITEFLPVSSSGHLFLIQYFTGQGGDDGLLFMVLLHFGTLLAVFVAFWSTISDLIREFFRILFDLPRGKFSWKAASPKRRMVLLLIVATLPMIITVFLRDWFASMATGDSLFPVGISFLITSALLFVADRCGKGQKTAKNMKITDAVAIGIMQALAPMPGISRSGSTIAVGLVAGLDKKYAVAFSFIISIPALLGANILEIGDAVQQGVTMSIPVMLVGVLFAFVVGLFAIKLVRWLVVSDKFKYFAWYTLVLGILVLIIAGVEYATSGLIRTILTR